MSALSPGEQAVWAARFNQAQTDVFHALHEQWVARSGGAVLPFEEGERLMANATMEAVTQANNVVYALRMAPISSPMLADILGPVVTPLPAPLEGLVGPWDMGRQPPPGMMFPGGQTEVVCSIAEKTGGLVALDRAWAKHVQGHDPPGYKTGRVDLGEYSLGINYEVRLAVLAEHGQILKQCVAMCDPFGGEAPTPADEAAAQKEARAYAWRCFQQPHHVSFWARFGDRCNLRLDTVLGWTVMQLDDAWRYLQARAAWQAKEPAMPEFWPSEE